MKKLILCFLAGTMLCTVAAQTTQSDVISQKIKEKQEQLKTERKSGNILFGLKKQQTKQKVKPDINFLKAIKYKLDSVIAGEYSKTIYTYDNIGNNISEIYYYYEEEMGWCIEKTVYSFNESGLLKTEFKYDYDNEEESWYLNEKNEYTYNSQNNLILVENFEPGETETEFYLIGKGEYFYDANQNDTLYITYEMDMENDTFMFREKTISTYDANGNILTEIYCYYDSDILEWDMSSKYVNTYNANKKQTSSINYFWDDIESDWIPSYKTETFYNKNNNDSIEYSYNWEDDDWAKSERTTYKYDANQNIIEVVMSQFYVIWIDYMKAVMEYNLAHSYSDLLLPYNMMYDEYKFNNEITKMSMYIINGVSSELMMEENYYYSQVVVSIVEPNRLEVTLYPNPSRDNINIVTAETNNATMQIVNNLGQIVIQQNLTQNTTQIDISGLQSGIYFVNIKTKDGLVTKKICKQ